LTLIITIIGLVIGSVLSRLVISPLSQLAQVVSDIEPEQEPVKITSKYYLGEVGTLAQTIENLISRIHEYIERERRFSREVSHELRTPVASMAIALDLIEATTTEEKHLKALDRVKRANKDMIHLIQTFLMLGRDTFEDMDCSQINVNSQIKEIIENNKHLLLNKPINIVTLIKENESLLVSEHLFDIISSNLLRNAFQYTNVGTITISFQKNQLQISDTGGGIPENEIENIGKPYHTLQNQGTGLGLSIVKRIVSKMNWEISINSIANEGTIITIEFL